MPVEDKILQDYVATANSGKYKSWEEINSKFPELKKHDPKILQDYVATANSGKYKSWEEINSKFPELKKKDLSGQDSKTPGEPSVENGGTPKLQIGKLENKIVNDKKTRTQISEAKKRISDNYEKIKSLDKESARDALRNEVLIKTENAYVADEAVKYLDLLYEEDDILDSENKEDFSQFDNVLSNIKSINDERINKNINQSTLPTQDKADRMAEYAQSKATREKIYSDYSNYLKNNDEKKYLSYQLGDFKDGAKGAKFYLDAIRHQRKSIDAKFKRNLIDEDTYKDNINLLVKENENYLKYFPEYKAQLKDKERYQETVDEAYNWAKKNINSANPLDGAKARGIVIYYQVISPAANAMKNFGVDMLASVGRLSATGKDPLESRAINNLVDDFTEYFDTESKTNPYQSPTSLKGSLYEDGEMDWEKITPKASETIAQMFTLIYSGSKYAKGFKGAKGILGKYADNMGLFTSSFLSTQNSYYEDAISEGLTDGEALTYSLTSATTTSMLEMISPQSYLTRKGVGKGVTKMFDSKKALKNISNGMSVSEAIWNNVKFFGKEVVKENVQEFSQEAGDVLNNYVFNAVTDSDLKTSMTGDEALELLTLTTIAGGLGSTGGFKGADQMRTESFDWAIKNQPDFEERVDKEVENGNLEEEKATNVKQKVQDFRETFNAIPKKYGEARRTTLSMYESDIKDLQRNKSILEAGSKNLGGIMSEDIKSIDNEIELIKQKAANILSLKQKEDELDKAPIKLYRGTKEKGEKGVVESVEKSYENVLEIKGDQLTHLEELSKDGDEKASDILKSENKWEEADKYMDELYGDEYDAIKYNQEHTNKPEEYYDTKDKKFYSVDEKYAKIAGTTYDRSQKFKQDDTKDETGVSSEEQVREESEQTELDEEASQSEVEAGGVVQEEQVTPPEPPKTTERPVIEGDKPEKAVQSISAYARGVIPNFEQRKSEWNPILTRLEKAKTSEDYEAILDRVDALSEKVTKRESVKIKNKIQNTVKNKKSILRKVGSKWKGKVPIEVQDFISNFDTSILEDMSFSELRDTEQMISDILKSGRREVAMNERIVKTIKRKNEANFFKAIRETNKGGKQKSVSGEEAVISELEKGNKSVIINGQLVSSKSALNEIKKDQDVNFNDITVYNTPSLSVQQANESLWRKATSWMNPVTAKNNLWNSMIPVFKGSKVLRENMEDLKSDIDRADFNMEEEVFNKTNDYLKQIKSIFGKKWKAVGRLGSDAEINPFEDYDTPPTNSVLVNMYNVGRSGVTEDVEVDDNGIPITDGYKKLLKSGLDENGIKELFDYIEGDSEFKKYADYLLNDFYPKMKEEYEPTYQHITNQKFPEGVYYPRFAESNTGEMIDNGELLDNQGNINYRDAVAGNLKQRTNHNLGINTDIGAHEVAMNYIRTMERAKQFIPVGEKVNYLFSKANASEILKKVGSVEFFSLKDHLAVVITGQDPRAGKTSTTDKVINSFMSYKILGSLAGKLASIPKQITSFTHFSTAKGVKLHEWLKGFVPLSKDEMKVVGDLFKSQYVKRRVKGRSFDIEVNRLLNDTRLSKAKRVQRLMTEVAMSPITIGDIGGVMLGGVPLAVAVYRQERAKGLSHEEAYSVAYERFVNESESAQQSTRAQETSHMQRHKVGRLFSAFTTSQTQTTNKLKAAVRTLMSKSDLTKEEKVENAYNVIYYSLANVGFAMVANGMVRQLVQGFEDEEEKEKAIYSTLMDNIQSILNGTGYSGVLANFIINELRGEEWKNTIPLIQSFGNISKSADAFISAMITEGKSWDELSESERNKIIKVLPVDGFLKQIMNFIKAKEGDKSFVEALFDWTSEEEQKKFKPKQDALYKLITGNDYTPEKTRRTSRPSRKSERTSR